MAKNNFCNRCPRKLSKLPTEMCSLGLEYITSQSDAESIGCPWGIASAEHNYCFWKWINAKTDLDGKMEPVPDKDTCQLLNITQNTLERTLSGAITKAKNHKGKTEWQGFREAVLDKAAIAPDDNTVYLPDNFRVEIPPEAQETEELPQDLMPKDKRRKTNSMPMHRSGKKTDLYGLTSKRKLVRKDK